MQYECTVAHIGPGSNHKKSMTAVNAEMAMMASNGWRLVSSSSVGFTRRDIYLFWEKI